MATVYVVIRNFYPSGGYDMVRGYGDRARAEDEAERMQKELDARRRDPASFDEEFEVVPLEVE